MIWEVFEDSAMFQENHHDYHFDTTPDYGYLGFRAIWILNNGKPNEFNPSGKMVTTSGMF